MSEKVFRLIAVTAVAFGMYVMGRTHGQRACTEVPGAIAASAQKSHADLVNAILERDDQIASATQLLEVNGKELGACRAKLKTERSSELKLEECLPDEGHVEAMWFCNDPLKGPPPERKASPLNQLEWCQQELTATGRDLLKCRVKLPTTEGQAYDKNGMCKPEYVGLNGLCQTPVREMPDKFPAPEGFWDGTQDVAKTDRAQDYPELEMGRIKFKTKPDRETQRAWMCGSLPVGNKCVWPEDQQ